MEIFTIKKEKSVLAKSDEQFKKTHLKVIEEMTRKKKELEKEYATLAAKHSELERKKIEADGAVEYAFINDFTIVNYNIAFRNYSVNIFKISSITSSYNIFEWIS